MKDFTSFAEEPLSQIRTSLNSVGTYFKKISTVPEETLKRWKIGRRNFS